jgi:diguanylate cyclase (GGDEF)-like protein
VASLNPGDRPEHHTNGAIGAHRENIPPRGATPPRDDTLGDADQTAADSEQTAADRDQTAADSDQTAADSDQAAADTDQAASDRHLGRGGDLDVHDMTRGLRDRSAQQRRENAMGRAAAADARDALAHARDLAALARDRAAALRDRELTARAADLPGDERAFTAAEIVLRAGKSRKRAADARATAAEMRARAAADREYAAQDRERAAHDRGQAQADRDALLHQLAMAETDALTGARARAAGLADLDREVDRARRTGAPLVVAYVDVVGLKAVNDAQGHAAGDVLLQRAVRAMRGQVRSYDTIVRLGGDEFLCVMSGATLEDARRRFDAVQAALRRGPEPLELRVGFAALAPQDSGARLIERADAELPIGRR